MGSSLPVPCEVCSVFVGMFSNYYTRVHESTRSVVLYRARGRTPWSGTSTLGLAGPIPFAVEAFSGLTWPPGYEHDLEHTQSACASVHRVPAR